MLSVVPIKITNSKYDNVASGDYVNKTAVHFPHVNN